MREEQRRARHERVSRALERLDDEQVRVLLAGGVRVAEGIGGPAVRVDVEGVPVFAKRLPLTDLERRAEHVGSTANLFDLPVFCHYGIGSPGFGSWREVAAATATTAAVLAGRADCFVLTYHWRVLEDVVVPVHQELADLEGVVAFWEHSPTVRARLQALRCASAVVVVFTEYVPVTLQQWLGDQLHPRATADLPGDPHEAQVSAAFERVAAQLRAAAEQMTQLGLLHLDAHFENIQTDGKRLYVTDFGLALADGFTRSEAERAFAACHTSYDESYVLTRLATWLLAAFTGHTGPDRGAVIAAAARGIAPPDLPAWAGAFVVRYAPVAAVVLPFYHQLQTQSRRATYPDRAAAQALKRLA